MKVEDATWAPKPGQEHRGKRPTQSLDALKMLEVGDVKRIVHDDLKCLGGARQCSLSAAISKQRKYGWILFSYHEAPHILVVRRDA